MSLKVLELDRLQLTSSKDHLKVSVISAVVLKLPTIISTLSNDSIMKALASGDTWLSRGIACSLDIEVFFDGKPLDCKSRLSLLESLGYRIRDAEVGRDQFLFSQIY